MSEPRYLLSCPACHQPLSARARMLGQPGKCRRCGAAFVVDSAAVTLLAEPGDAPQTREDLPEVAGWDDANRPWEQPGAFRRDCEQHRGGLIRGFGLASLFLGIPPAVTQTFLLSQMWHEPDMLSGLPFAPFAPVALVAPGAAFALGGLVLGVASWVLARRALRGMAAGRIDPGGLLPTRRGLTCGRIGTSAAGFALLVSLTILLRAIALSP